jgi:hypothetical protein
LYFSISPTCTAGRLSFEVSFLSQKSTIPLFQGSRAIFLFLPGWRVASILENIVQTRPI